MDGKEERREVAERRGCTGLLFGFAATRPVLAVFIVQNGTPCAPGVCTWAVIGSREEEGGTTARVGAGVQKVGEVGWIGGVVPATSKTCTQ